MQVCTNVFTPQVLIFSSFELRENLISREQESEREREKNYVIIRISVLLLLPAPNVQLLLLFRCLHENRLKSSHFSQPDDMRKKHGKLVYTMKRAFSLLTHALSLSLFPHSPPTSRRTVGRNAREKEIMQKRNKRDVLPENISFLL